MNTTKTRQQVIEKYREARNEIRDIIRTCDYWNSHVRKEGEPEVLADPDGTLTKQEKAISKMLEREDAELGPPQVYQMNDCDWWVARSLEQACLSYQADTGCTDEEFADVRCLTDKEMDTLRHMGDQPTHTEDGKKIIYPTFREALATYLAQGGEVPFLFASTEY